MWMNKRWIERIMFVCLLGAFGQMCWAEETIHWLAINYPPAYFIDGPRQGEGFCDVAGNLFRQNLLRYQHDIIGNISIPRMLEFFKETEQTYCIPGLGVTIGQFPHTVYSKAMSVVPSPGIMIRKADLGRFVASPNEQVSIERLLQDQTLIMGLFAEGQYGERIDALIRQYKGQPHLQERVGIDPTAALNMLAARRIDYMPVWAFTVQTSLLEALPLEVRESLMFLPVVESPPAKDAHAVCNDTLLGREVVEQINQVLLQEPYKQAVTGRLVEFLPESVQAEYRVLNLQQIGQ